MRKINIMHNSTLSTIVAALFLAFVETNLFYGLTIFMLVPVFYFIGKTSIYKATLNGFIFGFVYGLVMFYVMTKVISVYSGNSYWYCLVFVFLSAAVLGIYFAIVLSICKKLWIQNPINFKTFLINRLAIASLWALLEFGLSSVLSGMTFNDSRLGIPLTTNLFTIQWATLGGITVFTFLVVFVNLLITEFLFNKKYSYLKCASATIVAIFLCGAILYYSFEPTNSNKPFKVALVSQNLHPEIQWDPNNGNELAKNIIDRCKEAANENPDFMVWTECIVPWTYAKNDDLLNEIFKISKGKNITQVIGLNEESANDNTKIHNAVFYFDENKAPQVYHKKILLKGIEEPLGAIVIPNINNEGYSYIKGSKQMPIDTKFGKAGTLICSESTEEAAIMEQTKSGASFFFNLSNDGWFGESYLSEYHFYYTRLMAVMSRKDIAISNSRGYSALIESSGKISTQIKSKAPTVLLATVHPNADTTIYSSFPNLIVLILLLFLLLNFIIINKVKILKTNPIIQ
jgi:apolipoprotein N-acyltransferase